jgi:hypothetical protein
VLVVKDLERVPAIEEVTDADKLAGGLHEVLLAVAQHAYRRLARGEVLLGAICLHGALDGGLHPYTGLLAGFLSALSRELPGSVCKQANAPSGNLAEALAWLEAEWAQGGLPSPVEISYPQGRRHVPAIAECQVPGEGPWLTSDSVVLASGGGRGITAALAETLLRRFGCTLVLLGRTDPQSLPTDMRRLDAEELERFEPEFYRRELARNPAQRMPELKKRF